MVRVDLVVVDLRTDEPAIDLDQRLITANVEAELHGWAQAPYPSKADVDANYVKAMQLLMKEGNYPGIATHDEKIITAAKRFAASA